MTAIRISGTALADTLRAEVAQGVSRLQSTTGVTPGLAVVLVGEDPASQVYVRNKIKQTEAVGMRSTHHLLAADTSATALLALIDQLNADPAVHGILVQLPLPPHLEAKAVIEAIDPRKDVDGFHTQNVGSLWTEGCGFVPCTPLGCLHLLQTVRRDIAGLHAVIVGRSTIVGRPMAALLLNESCTVTIAHSKTQALPALCKTADILVAAVGRPQMIKAEWIKPGAIVLDVGINRIAQSDGSTRLVGDVDFEAALAVAGAITPVPGGPGPMTIACLLANTLEAATRMASA
ncbi:MAG: bifunctional methylenetetrahydrofolate dehydrogenase/methenyltetrahydrofolate cyclohydrolase FolD [Gammaproteobacteria bacterium]|nr:bifunctional methylenetetrahydrofolate dehydrogenase/methenyltetrahydrofolate cyclohydrolase FolD [Gammaproteobacteria bacterium]